ncbi:hypothetical protein HY090_00360 [Candidatus Kaiserbacteria bacterium]|nr:hypothetical protein [Candidatus Kaiserbacteria bacterium]
MFESGIDFKLIAAAIAPIFSMLAYVPYITGIFKGTVRPHVYSWLIWTLSTGTATAGLWYGGGGWAAVSATIGVVFTFLFFLLSFKYGTKNITTSDTFFLLFALAAIGVWWQLHQPLLAIILVSLIDLSAYAPTYRKSWEEPWSETMLPWVLWAVQGCLLIIALKNYNPLTLTFILSTTVLANFLLIAILFFRRRIIPKPAL